MEISLVRAATLNSALVNPMEEAIIRSALSVARLYKVRHDGHDVGVGAFVAPFRDEVSRRLTPVLLGSKAPTREGLLPHVRDLRERTVQTRDAIAKRYQKR